MSEYFQRKYRPIADALLAAHGLAVPGDTRDMLADTIVQSRELATRNAWPAGSRSPLPALRMARIHARKLVEYADHPPTRTASLPLQCSKVAAAIRSNEITVGFYLELADIETNALLGALDAGKLDLGALRRLVRVADDVEESSGGIGRPWAIHTAIVRAGCIAWERAGRRVTCAWNAKSGEHKGKLTGALPVFLRDLIACCDGTHELVRERPRRVPVGYRDPRPVPRGDLLRKRVPGYVLRDAIYAWRESSKRQPAKS